MCDALTSDGQPSLDKYTPASMTSANFTVLETGSVEAESPSKLTSTTTATSASTGPPPLGLVELLVRSETFTTLPSETNDVAKASEALTFRLKPACGTKVMFARPASSTAAIDSDDPAGYEMEVAFPAVAGSRRKA